MIINVTYSLYKEIPMEVDDKFKPLVTESEDVDMKLWDEFIHDIEAKRRKYAKAGMIFPTDWNDIADLEAIWDETRKIAMAEF